MLPHRWRVSLRWLGSVQSRREPLSGLSFGRVDAEALTDLDRRFVETRDFDTVVGNEANFILGPKGSGKSTICELFSRFENTAARFADGRLDNVRVVTGTGLLDSGDLATDDIEQLRGEQGYDHEKLWRLYIALECAMSLLDEEVHSGGPVREVLRATGDVKDQTAELACRATGRRSRAHPIGGSC